MKKLYMTTPLEQWVAQLYIKHRIKEPYISEIRTSYLLYHEYIRGF